MRRALLVVALLLAPGAPAARADAPSVTVTGTKVAWDTATSSPGEVRVAGEDGQEKLFATGVPSGEQDAPWLAGGGRYIFRLYCPWTDALIASVTLAGSKVERSTSTGTCTPPSSPEALDFTLRVLSLALPALLVVGIAWYVRSRYERVS